MSNFFIAFLVALGAGGWIAKKFYKSTGGNAQKSITAGIVTGALTLLIVLSLLALIPQK